jgi:hypothetical protein
MMASMDMGMVGATVLASQGKGARHHSGTHLHAPAFGRQAESGSGAQQYKLIFCLIPAAILGGYLGSEFGSKRLHHVALRRLLALALTIAAASALGRPEHPAIEAMPGRVIGAAQQGFRGIEVG